VLALAAAAAIVAAAAVAAAVATALFSIFIFADIIVAVVVAIVVFLRQLYTLKPSKFCEIHSRPTGSKTRWKRIKPVTLTAAAAAVMACCDVTNHF